MPDETTEAAERVTIPLEVLIRALAALSDIADMGGRTPARTKEGKRMRAIAAEAIVAIRAIHGVVPPA